MSRARVDVLQLLYSTNHNFTAAFIQYHHSVILNHYPRQAAPHCTVYIYLLRREGGYAHILLRGYQRGAAVQHCIIVRGLKCGTVCNCCIIIKG